MGETRKIAVTVNGTRHEAEVEVRLTLADFLRHTLGLTGTHLGCEHGVCGACTVLLDGLAARSCLTLAVQAEGAAVLTVEGLPKALIPERVFQCGFFRAGFVVSAAALLSAGRTSSRQELAELLAGN